MKHLKTAFLVLFSMVSLNIHAYTYITCTDGTPLDFNGGHMTFNYANNLSTDQKSAISRGHSRVTYFSDSSITTVDNGDSSFSGGNGQNEIYLDSSVGTAHCAYWYYDSPSCYVDEADMAYGNQTWKTVDNSQHLPYASGRSMTGTAVHEGGHCIGMAHTNNLYNMMGAEYSHVTRQSLDAWYGPGEDLSDGLIDLHGKKTTTDARRDVGITVMRYDGVSGEYSTHKFGVLQDSTDVTLPVVGSYVGQPMYRVIAGQTLKMQLTAENNGELNLEEPNGGYYLSTNDYISTSDTLLHSETWTLGRNTPYEYTETVTIPVSTAAGNYFLGAYIDSDGLIPEHTAANNYAYYPINVVLPPDLVVITPAVSDSTLTPGQAFTASATVQNQGGATSDSTTLRYYRSTNSIISTGDTEIGTDYVASLTAGGTSFESVSLTAPTTEGTYYIGACVDTVALESPTTNQCSTGVQITVGTPDLVVINPAVDDATLTPSQPFVVSATVQNQGTYISTSTTLRYYVSKDITISTGDVEISTDLVDGLKPAGTSDEAAKVTAPPADGTYYIGACVDVVPNETLTANQCSKAVQIKVNTPTYPDLVVINPSVSASTLLPGELFTIGATVRNQGSASSTATTLRYYRSTDSTISTSDTELGTDAILALSPSATSAQTLDTTAPASDGTYWVGACVDAVAGESSTSNQCSTGVEISVESQLFTDVPPSYWAYDWIQTLAQSGITSGCGAGIYCPENPVTRASMAIFLERGIHGSSYVPPPATGTVFNDVSISYWAAAWIEQLFADGITTGCGGGNYCPNNNVSRAQMAIFLLRSKHGAAYVPPPATGTMFDDVSISYWAAPWIEQLAREGITSGCDASNYCPGADVKRSAMAVFLVRTFSL